MTTALLPALPAKNSPVTAAQLIAIESKVSSTLRKVNNLEELQEWHAKARALEAYLRSPELQRPMLGAQRRIEARIGELLGNPLKGGRGKLSGMPEGFDHKHLAADFRLIARALSGDCPLTADEWRKSRRALVSLVRLKLGLMPVTPPLPDGTYRCIVADPPWRLDTGPDIMGSTGERGHDQLAYEQMSLETIRALDVPQLAAPDAHLYLWTTNRYVEDAYGIARAWGFKPSVLLVWCKTPRGIGLGDTFRQTCEFVLFARRGNLTARRIVGTTWFNWPRGAHSVKPPAFYALVESVTPSPYLDMFARHARKGWDVWGAEAPKQAAGEQRWA